MSCQWRERGESPDDRGCGDVVGVPAPAPCSPYLPREVEQGQRFQHCDETVAVDARMGRGEEQERDEAARHSLKGDERDVEPPPVASLDDLNHGHAQRQHKPCPSGFARREPCLGFCVGSLWRQLSGFCHGWAAVARFVHDDSSRHVPLEQERQEVLSGRVERLVGFSADEEVLPEAQPRILSREHVQEVAIAVRRVVRPADFAVHGHLDDVPRLRRTILVEEVVAVDPVLGQVVSHQKGKEAGLFVAVKVEHLFVDESAVLSVVHYEVVKGCDAQLVVGLAQDEAPDEMRLLEVEHAVVERPVFARAVVAHAYGRVAVDLIDLFARSARDEAHMQRVCGRPRRRGVCGCQPQAGKP